MLPMSTPPLLTVTYTAEADEVFEFHTEGQSRLFGRDDTRCDIVVWSAINGSDLSRVAGRIWRLEDELWVRNLSTRHELAIRLPGGAVLDTLPVRRENGVDRGPARSLPAPLAYVVGPSGCDLEVTQIRVLVPAAADFDGPYDPTRRLPALSSIRADLQPVAVALCRPILSGGTLPAAYREIMRDLGVKSQKRVRTLVSELCRIYQPTAHAPNGRGAQPADGEELGSPRIGPGGVRHWDLSTVPETEARARARPEALPDSYAVAHLLVRRGLVTAADLDVGPHV